MMKLHKSGVTCQNGEFSLGTYIKLISNDSASHLKSYFIVFYYIHFKLREFFFLIGESRE
jgi:hypothetical protein